MSDFFGMVQHLLPVAGAEAQDSEVANDLRVKALQAATSNAAELLRVSDVGTVGEGMAADLVVWPGNPLEDPSLLLRPEVVMQAGEVSSAAGTGLAD